MRKNRRVTGRMRELKRNKISEKDKDGNNDSDVLVHVYFNIKRDIETGKKRIICNGGDMKIYN